jgi:hypothetical protein
MDNIKITTSYQYLVKEFHASDTTALQNWLSENGKIGFKFIHAYQYGGFGTSKMTIYTLMREYEDIKETPLTISFETENKKLLEEESIFEKTQIRSRIIKPKNPFRDFPPNQDVPF